MKKQVNIMLSIFMILSMILVACGPAATPTQAPAVPTTVVTEAPPVVTEAPPTQPPASDVTLKIWLTWPESPEKMQNYFNGFTEATGIKTEVNTSVPYDKIIAGMSGSDSFDLLILGDIFSIAMFADNGLIMPLDDLIAANNIDTADMFDAPRSQCYYKEQFVCLPWGTDLYALFWNKDMFEAAGLDPEKPPETWEQMLEYADKLTKTDDQGNLTQVGFIPDFPWSHTDLFLAMQGSTWQSADGTKVQLDTPEMLATLKWQQEFYTRYGADKVSRFLSSAGNYKGADSGFYTDKIAMLVDGEWQPGVDYIQKYRPDLNYGIVSMPYPEASPELKGTAVEWGTVVEVPANAQNLTETGKLLAWMMEAKNQVDMMIQIPNLPSSHAAAADSRWSELPDLQLFIDIMNGGKAQNIYVGPVTYDILTELSAIQEKVFLAGEDPAPLLKAAQETIQAKLDEALGK
ncbi:MAG: extracellular solute-binding protein [Acidobacteriaceae bacterium]